MSNYVVTYGGVAVHVEAESHAQAVEKVRSQYESLYGDDGTFTQAEVVVMTLADYDVLKDYRTRWTQ